MGALKATEKPGSRAGRDEVTLVRRAADGMKGAMAGSGKEGWKQRSEDAKDEQCDVRHVQSHHGTQVNKRSFHALLDAAADRADETDRFE